jgi:hypothetical protein
MWPQFLHEGAREGVGNPAKSFGDPGIDGRTDEIASPNRRIYVSMGREQRREEASVDIAAYDFVQRNATSYGS